VKRAKGRSAKKVIRNWRHGRALLARWWKKCANLQVELKRPRVIDVVPIDYLRGEPVGTAGEGKKRFRGRLIFVTNADVTIRRPSGAILIIDNYEIVSLSDSRHRFEPAKPS